MWVPPLLGRVAQKINVFIPFGPGIVFLEVYPTKAIRYVDKDEVFAEVFVCKGKMCMDPLKMSINWYLSQCC
jgi:hypothetical protein